VIIVVCFVQQNPIAARRWVQAPAKEPPWRGFQRIAGLAQAGENAHDIQMRGVGGGKAASYRVGSAG